MSALRAFRITKPAKKDSEDGGGGSSSEVVSSPLKREDSEKTKAVFEADTPLDDTEDSPFYQKVRLCCFDAV